MKKGGRTVPRSPNRYAAPLGLKTPAQRSHDDAAAGQFAARSFDQKAKPRVRPTSELGLGPPLYDVERGPLPRVTPKRK